MHNRSRSNKPQAGRRLPAYAESSTAPEASRQGRRRFRYYTALFLAWVIIPIALIVLLEVGLRAADYGRTTHFLIEKQNDLGAYHMLNMSFYKQFLYVEEESVGMEPFDVVVPPKTEETYRVLVLGGSAALGWYFADYSFWRYFETMLREAKPDAQIEVICAAWFGMNSHVMRHIATQCEEIQPDLVLVYLGNNEMTGPFGLLTRGGSEDTSPAALERQIQLHLFASNLRLMQLLGGPALDLTFSIAGGKRWGFDAAIERMDDPRLQRVYKHYELNLNEICAAATASGADVVLSTVARNQRHWRPRNSIHRQGWTKDDDRAWQVHMDAGAAAMAAGDPAAAKAAYEAAAALDPEYALTHYLLGRAMLPLGEVDAAREALAQAWSLDYTLDSATPTINAAVERVASDWQGQGVYFLDAFKELSALSPQGLLGEEYLYDHIHLTKPGCYELARLFFEAARPALPDALQPGEAGAPSFDACQERMGASPAVYAKNLEIAVDAIAGMWPEHDTSRFVQQAEALRAQVEKPEPIAVREGYERAVELNPNDFVARYRLASYLLDTDRSSPILLPQAEELQRRHPFQWRSHMVLARAELAAGKVEEGVATARRLLALYPEYPESYLQLGRILEQADDFEAALEAYAQAASMRPIADVPLSFMTTLLNRMGRIEDAIAAAEKAVAENPRSPVLYENLDRLLRETLSREARIAYWEQAAATYTEEPHAAALLDQARKEP